MSNLSDFFPSGGGGVKINQLTQFGNAPILYVDNDGEEYLKAGNILTDTNLYPDSNYKGGNLDLASFVQTKANIDGSTYAESLAFSDDGTKMFVANLANDRVVSFTLSTAFDISTATYDGDVTTGAGQCFGLCFGDNGRKMYVMGVSAYGVQQLTLTTPWDIFTNTDRISFSVSSQDTAAKGIQISLDGTKFYVTGSNSDQVFQYDLSTPFDLSTATYKQLFEPAFNDPQDLYLSNTGDDMYLINTSEVKHFYLSTPWDISTAVPDEIFSIGTDGRGIFFKDDLTKMFVSGRTSSGSVTEWDILPYIGLSSADNLDANTYIRIK